MTFLWLFVWVCSSTPPVILWQAWAVALAVCIVIDVLGTIEEFARRDRAKDEFDG